MVLDADGVVINGERARVAFERDFGITPALTGSFFRGRFLDCLVGTADLVDCLAPLLPGWGWHGTLQQYIDYWFQSEHHLDEQLLAEVDRLRALGVPCYLATNQERYRTAYMRDAMGLGGRFDAVYSSCEVGYLKTDERFWDAVKRELEPLPASQILFWDDSAGNVDAAARAGLQARLYDGFESLRAVTSALGLPS
jgi:putative hydrolase of the HAD superfamily